MGRRSTVSPTGPWDWEASYNMLAEEYRGFRREIADLKPTKILVRFHAEKWRVTVSTFQYPDAGTSYSYTSPLWVDGPSHTGTKQGCIEFLTPLVGEARARRAISRYVEAGLT